MKNNCNRKVCEFLFTIASKLGTLLRIELLLLHCLLTPCVGDYRLIRKEDIHPAAQFVSRGCKDKPRGIEGDG